MRTVASAPAWIAVLGLAVGVAGCALDAASNTHGTACDDAHPCAVGTCYRGFCVSGDAMDGGADDGGRDGGTATPDTGVDAGQDAGNDAAFDGGDWCDGSMMTCTTGQPGACSPGHIVCGTAGGSCTRDLDPTAEVCGHATDMPDDEDCDGVIDEESSVRCYSGTVGCVREGDGYRCAGACRPGTQACTSGTLGVCTGSVTPAASETCQGPSETGVDENCNGMVDEGCTCTDGTMRACFTGAPAQAGVGECHNGMQTCSGGAWGDCSGDVLPVAETCMNNGQDDDCDGHIDNIPGSGVACSLPAMGDCGDGTMTCSGGSLQCVAPTAAAAEVCDHHDDDCDGAIDESFSFASDPMNCGDCNNVCGAGTTCCNGACVDESSDALNCGGCTTQCNGEMCCNSSCIDTQNDPMNCGSCGNVCSSSQLCCSGSCIDPLTDEANCNGCGMGCSGTNDTCCGGVCHVATAPACTGCAVDCSMQDPPTSCCGNSCTDRMSDELNCGACGHACGATEVCCGGTCQANDARHCGGACADCGTGLCCSNSCVPIDTRHCQSCGVSCPMNSTCCGDGCHNLATDAANCGTCGMNCGGTNVCSSSHCCPAGRTWCGSSCVNLDTDGSNCGYCGHSCLLGCNGSGGCNIL